MPAAPAVITPGDILSTTAAGILYIAPDVLGLGPEVSRCAPCDQRDLPGFDRWALRQEVPAWSAAGTLALVALAAGAEWDLARRGEDGWRAAVALLQSMVWAYGSTTILKALAGRMRPVLYDPAVDPDSVVVDDLRSLPSGHTAGAFAVATSWWLSQRWLREGGIGVPAWVGFVVAAGVGVSRVAAGRHFPSDVLAGAALGVACALTVHTIKF